MEIDPTWQNAFRGELTENLRRVSNDFTRQLYIIDISTECVWYATDMCLHYYHQGAFNGITQYTIDKICYNVCYAMTSVVKEFSSENYADVNDKVTRLMADPRTYSILQEEVDKYYRR